MKTEAKNPDDAGRDAAAREARRAVAEIAALAGGLAHELRNPLSTMMVNLKLLAEDLRDDRASAGDVRRRALRKVDILRREAERLQNLFDEFLNLTSPCRLVCTPTDLQALVARLVEFFEPLASNHHVTIEVAGADGPVVCPVDEALLSRALLNLVINAQEAMPEGGTLRIDVRPEGAGAVIAVSDSGVGIAEVDREKVLRPFYSTKETGTGLGLSLTQQIIREHGGRLAWESEMGKGTTFRVHLPG